ncbi:hypothetical protein F9802_13025 [Bacillus aerolatus]|uniref:Uncharacterized protein n=1 Tax=Bacillus aerolatus TaxID=2653354 RepID=A0A6I1FE21_9BACI|nr:hypothetical protein [Bacillus aerolatus]KAB7705982.1 hypothetical protein F9802_13025 [Bacillus aerolatus]
MVQKVAEAVIPLAALGITPVPGTPLPLITVTVDTAGIVQNATILRDKVVNMGTVPVTISVAGAVGLPFTLQFQEHTDCPGACPEDTLIETPLQVEGTLVQPILGATIAGLVDVDVAVVKVILRTTITVVRPLIAKTNHHAFDCLQDVNPDRCETPTIPTTVTFPTTTPPAGGGGGV